MKADRKKNPLFSVIVPAYNTELYLGRCLDGILKQSYRNFELILVIDKTSPDKTAEIADAYEKKDRRILKLHRGHYGLSDARNYGMKYSSGEYFIFVDADDYMGAAGYLADIADCIEKKNPDLIITKYRKCSEDGKKIWKTGIVWDPEMLQIKDIHKKLSYVLNTGYFNISAWGKAVKRQLIIENELFFVPGYSEDADWTPRVLNHAKTAEVLNTDGFVHRVRSSSLSHDWNIKQVRDGLKRLYDWQKLADPDTKFGRAQLGHMAYIYCTLLAFSGNLSHRDRKKLKPEFDELAYLMNYAVSKKAKLGRLACRCFGTWIASDILYFYIRFKGI